MAIHVIKGDHSGPFTYPPLFVLPPLFFTSASLSLSLCFSCFYDLGLKMGNANGKENDAVSNFDADATSSSAISNGIDPYSRTRDGRPSSDSMSSSPPGSPATSPSPLLFAPPVSRLTLYTPHVC